MNPHIGVNVHIKDDTFIESHPLRPIDHARYVEVLKVGAGSTDVALFVDSRIVAERLLAAVSELTARWVEREPRVIEEESGDPIFEAATL